MCSEAFQCKHSLHLRTCAYSGNTKVVFSGLEFSESSIKSFLISIILSYFEMFPIWAFESFLIRCSNITNSSIRIFCDPIFEYHKFEHSNCLFPISHHKRLDSFWTQFWIILILNVTTIFDFYSSTSQSCIPILSVFVCFASLKSHSYAHEYMWNLFDSDSDSCIWIVSILLEPLQEPMNLERSHPLPPHSFWYWSSFFRSSWCSGRRVSSSRRLRNRHAPDPEECMWLRTSNRSTDVCTR